ncbi:ATP-binding protein [Actinomyces minihominis]|uniref:ATP-binding protein n=1 Tax=Actinomyces minihominis TaxID=2002838 RepID=UPI000C075DF4|nr:ATP-binding protein [Actinomyces minihominis]
MRRRATRMIMTAVLAVVFVLGVPAAIMAGVLVWNTNELAVEVRTQIVARAVDRRLNDNDFVTQAVVSAWASAGEGQADAYVVVTLPGRYTVVSGVPHSGPVIKATYTSSQGVRVETEISANKALRQLIVVEALILVGVLLSVLLAWYLANVMARRLSAPLIYLAAQAEQIGSGQVRAQVKPSGIEEIDLVQEELVRTGEKMARRLAAERQRSADASHQLRTPLTALSMRLEEIQMISTETEIQEEAEAALGQVERLTTVVNDLLDSSRRSSSNTEVVQVLEVFNTEREEWEPQFTQAGRSLLFIDEAAQLVLAEEGKLAQILAILLENSLRYGRGTTVVKTRKAGSSRAVLVDVSDEGNGIDPEIAAEIFDMGFSSHGSSGIGLALAKDLAKSMGARLELSSLNPTVFTVSLPAIPANFDPNLVLPRAPIVSVSRKTRRF